MAWGTVPGLLNSACPFVHCGTGTQTVVRRHDGRVINRRPLRADAEEYARSCGVDGPRYSEAHRRCGLRARVPC